MSISVKQFRKLIREVLKNSGLWTPAAEELLVMTAAHESQMGTYIEQIGGPALGIFQVEPTTQQDLYDNFLLYRPQYKSILNRHSTSNLRMDLKANLPYQIVLARLIYLRDSEPLPDADDVVGLALYYKRVWNTHKGKAKVGKVIANYKRFANVEI